MEYNETAALSLLESNVTIMDSSISSSRSDDLTDLQQDILTFLPLAPTLLSVSASATILYLVMRSGFTSSYKRILFGLSVSDILTSLTFAVQPFLLPVATSRHPWASGSDATCTMLGTLTQLSLSTLMYNGILSYYYLLTIRFNVRESVFARRYEPWMHAVAIAYPVVTAVAGASLDLYHELDIGHGCWIAEKACSVDDNQDCRQGIASGRQVQVPARFFGWLFTGWLAIFILLSVVVINVIIYRHVRRQMARGRRHSFHTQQQTNRTQLVAVQCFLYVAALVGTFGWAVLLRILDSSQRLDANEVHLYPLRVVNAVMIPLTGFFNLCIYLRPRYIKTRINCPHESRLWAVQRALYGQDQAAIPSNKTACIYASTDLASLPFGRTPPMIHQDDTKSMQASSELGLPLEDSISCSH